jgi:hypothetical protein
MVAKKSYKAPGSKSPKQQSRREKGAVKAKKVKPLPYEVRWDYTARIEL